MLCFSNYAVFLKFNGGYVVFEELDCSLDLYVCCQLLAIWGKKKSKFMVCWCVSMDQIRGACDEFFFKNWFFSEIGIFWSILERGVGEVSESRGEGKETVEKFLKEINI